MTDISSALQRVSAAIGSAAQAAGRNADSVTLLAVSKTFPAAAVREAYAAGQRRFGENYVQELQAKAAELQDLALEWHFIGPLQSNKTRPVAELAHWVHSVERLKIAERLSAQRPAALPALNVCIQVNVSGEDSKSGCAPDEVLPLAQAIAALPGLRLRGLMCIPEPTQEAATLAARFGVLATLQQRLAAAGIATDTLSMGMSADMAAAIAAGSTMVRVGTAIFGARHYG
ncbi:YggS family pyridoxal phosphate-dependent enzyme [Vogesella indigofera]|uniref:YggS family pyridoxal phosphate-dependent enzyme n=1 Tax=Vogesella indigofera TaxID=45465 RepID=UPI003F430D2B